MEQSWRQFHGQGLQVQFHSRGFLHRILFQAYFPSKSLFLSKWVIFIVFYTDTHWYSFIFQIIQKMFTGLCENCFHLHETALQLFLLFGTNIIFFSALNRNKFKNVFRFPLRTLSELSRRVTRSSSVSFPFLFHPTRHGVVGQRSGTGLETPLLGWALPLWRFSTMWALVSMFLLSFSTRVMLSLSPISSLYFDTLSMVTWCIIQLQIY